MKRTAFALTLILALLFSAVAGAQFNNVKAETLGPLVWGPPEYPDYPEENRVTIFSPQNTTYSGNSIFVNFTVNGFVYVPLTSFYSIYDVGYSLDEGPIEKITNLTYRNNTPSGSPAFYHVTYLGNLTLSGLQNGEHSLTIYQGRQYDEPDNRYQVYASASANFAMNTPLSPEPFPTALVMASIAAVIVVGVVLLVYFKKRKR